MTLVDIPAEQTTAATDLLIAILAFFAAVHLGRNGPAGLRGRLWRSVLVLLTVAAFLGALGHGIVLGEGTYHVLWSLIYLPLGLVVAMFLSASIRDLGGDGAGRRSVPVLVVVALGFVVYALLEPDNFLPFILYELAGMSLSLLAFIRITARQDLAGARWITAAIAVNMLAAGIQAEGSLGFELIWTFDHNGVFHLVQIVGLGLLVWGLRAGAPERN